MLEVAAAVIFDPRGRVLVCRRAPGGDLAGSWEFPGGKLEPGETAAGALARECLEELGVVAEVGELLGVTVHRYPGRTVRLSFLAARLLAGPPRALVHAEIRWVAPGELSDLELCPADRAMAARIASGLFGPPGTTDRPSRPGKP
jgi:8-oxo-dGTP diphosphatase